MKEEEEEEKNNVLDLYQFDLEFNQKKERQLYEIKEKFELYKLKEEEKKEILKSQKINEKELNGFIDLDDEFLEIKKEKEKKNKEEFSFENLDLNQSYKISPPLTKSIMEKGKYNVLIEKRNDYLLSITISTVLKEIIWKINYSLEDLNEILETEISNISNLIYEIKKSVENNKKKIQYSEENEAFVLSIYLFSKSPIFIVPIFKMDNWVDLNSEKMEEKNKYETIIYFQGEDNLLINIKQNEKIWERTFTKEELKKIIVANYSCFFGLRVMISYAIKNKEYNLIKGNENLVLNFNSPVCGIFVIPLVKESNIVYYTKKYGGFLGKLLIKSSKATFLLFSSPFVFIGNCLYEMSIIPIYSVLYTKDYINKSLTET